MMRTLTCRTCATQKAADVPGMSPPKQVLHDCRRCKAVTPHLVAWDEVVTARAEARMGRTERAEARTTNLVAPRALRLAGMAVLLVMCGALSGCAWLWGEAYRIRGGYYDEPVRKHP